MSIHRGGSMYWVARIQIQKRGFAGIQIQKAGFARIQYAFKYPIPCCNWNGGETFNLLKGGRKSGISPSGIQIQKVGFAGIHLQKVISPEYKYKKWISQEYNTAKYMLPPLYEKKRAWNGPYGRVVFC